MWKGECDQLASLTLDSEKLPALGVGAGRIPCTSASLQPNLLLLTHIFSGAVFCPL